MARMDNLLIVALIAMCACTSSQEAKGVATASTPGAYNYNPPVAMHPLVAAPRSLTATATGANSVRLSWVASDAVNSGYWLTSRPGSINEEVSEKATGVDVGGLKTNTMYTFSLQAIGVNQMSMPASVSVTTSLPTSNVIAGIPQYYQLPQSCEETSLSMVLVHQGLTISTKQILAREGVDNTQAVVKNGRLTYGGDPDKAFVGSVYAADSVPDGPTSYPKLLMRVLDSYGAGVVEWSEPGVTGNTISAQEIYKEVLMGHPVVAYATWNWRHYPTYYYTSEDGNKVVSIYPAPLHVYAVVGVNATSVLVHDPIRGTYWVSKASFEAAYEFGMAIVLQ